MPRTRARRTRTRTRHVVRRVTRARLDSGPRADERTQELTARRRSSKRRLRHGARRRSLRLTDVRSRRPLPPPSLPRHRGRLGSTRGRAVQSLWGSRSRTHRAPGALWPHADHERDRPQAAAPRRPRRFTRVARATSHAARPEPVSPRRSSRAGCCEPCVPDTAPHTAHAARQGTASRSVTRRDAARTEPHGSHGATRSHRRARPRAGTTRAAPRARPAVVVRPAGVRRRATHLGLTCRCRSR